MVVFIVFFYVSLGYRCHSTMMMMNKMMKTNRQILLQYPHHHHWVFSSLQIDDDHLHSHKIQQYYLKYCQYPLHLHHHRTVIVLCQYLVVEITMITVRPVLYPLLLRVRTCDAIYISSCIYVVISEHICLLV